MGASESKQQIRRIFDCVDKNDVEGLKLLMDHPKFYQIRDAFGNTILHRAISKSRFSVFNFLLSLDDFAINARNYKGKTALEACLSDYPDWCYRCSYSLIEKGANIDCIRDKTSFLHKALDGNEVNAARCLIENGADINSCKHHGQRPIHRVNGFEGDVNEFLAMMLYFGADPSIPDYRDNRVIDYALANGRFSESMQEHLVFYFFDDYCTDYDIPLFTLFGLFQSDYSFAPLVLKHITSVNLDKVYYLEQNSYFKWNPWFYKHGALIFGDSYKTKYFKVLGFYFKKLFTIKPEYLKFLLEKFDYVIEAILDASLKTEFHYWPPAKEMFIENFDLLLHSQFGSDLIEVIDKIRINILIEKLHCDLESIMVVLTCGANIYDKDMEVIYDTFGDCEFFRMLLHMDIKLTNERRRFHLIPGLFYDMRIMDIETFLDDPFMYRCSKRHVIKERLLNYFAHPNLKDYCECYSTKRKICRKVKRLPSVPLLVELARNKVRQFLIDKYKITNSMQFYTLIKRLPISKVHEKIITFETKLYLNY